jgi:hypothetical protein
MAEQDHPRGSQAAPRGRVGLGHVAFQNGAVGRQRQSGRRDHVLKRDRQSGERAGQAARTDLISLARRLRRLSLIDPDERAELPVPVRDAFQAGGGEFPRRDLPRVQRRGGFQQVQVGRVGSGHNDVPLFGRGYGVARGVAAPVSGLLARVATLPRLSPPASPSAPGKPTM